MITRDDIEKTFPDEQATKSYLQLLVLTEKLLSERDELKDMESFYKSELEHAKEKCDQALKERDLARAHDQQPYPTAHAYDQVCKTLNDERRWKQAYREVAIQNYNAPESLTDETICKLADAEAKRIVEGK